jgi:hypothetical protein
MSRRKLIIVSVEWLQIQSWFIIIYVNGGKIIYYRDSVVLNIGLVFSSSDAHINTTVNFIPIEFSEKVSNRSNHDINLNYI